MVENRFKTIDEFIFDPPILMIIPGGKPQEYEGCEGFKVTTVKYGVNPPGDYVCMNLGITCTGDEENPPQNWKCIGGYWHYCSCDLKQD